MTNIPHEKVYERKVQAPERLFARSPFAIVTMVARIRGQVNEDMLRQAGRLLSRAWRQVREKLAAMVSLFGQRGISMEFLRQQRTRFSLSNSTLRAIEQALNEDEFESTDSLFDWFNAVSRVASHNGQLSFRQRRTLGRIAGELSQFSVHRCSACGSWLVQDN